MVFVKEESEEDKSEPETCRIKHEEQEGLMKVKEERQDLNEVEEKHQHQKTYDVTTGEKSHFRTSAGMPSLPGALPEVQCCIQFL
ncbi:uncharacterized protein [Sinocyclocheilus grahami]|uniref:uncharacterized protein isoform X2 n=1 Tax=Sinocyclocheilus grahami TaxID=75366 RepID=UPI0007AC9DB8|nr:PREDICTED: uncharacterized protein LOC107561082 isoform X2 [Sinocyclocheilus grahami]